MNIQSLSIETYGTLEKAFSISKFLKVEFEEILITVKDETSYLNAIEAFVSRLLDDQTKFLREWLIESQFETAKLRDLKQYILFVKAIPVESRIFPESSFVREPRGYRVSEEFGVIAPDSKALSGHRELKYTHFFLNFFAAIVHGR